MGECLRLSQLLRLLKDGDSKTLCHVNYWMGEVLEDFLPNMTAASHAQVTPAYFNSLADIFATSIIEEAFFVHDWRSIRNKQLYKQRVEAFKQTKVEFDAGKPHSIHLAEPAESLHMHKLVVEK